jgi:hypothetical protein
VLLIRGELLRRYPNTVIYAVRAAETDDGRDLSTNPDDERHPVFRGTLQPDVTFVGFDLTPDDVVTGSGWFFVLQQQPTEPRFGLDEAPYLEGKTDVPELATWNDLNWAHLAPDEATLKELGILFRWASSILCLHRRSKVFGVATRRTWPTSLGNCRCAWRSMRPNC